MLKGTLVLGALLAAGPANAAIERGTPITLTDVQRKAAEAAVLERLKDPESARFGDAAGAKDSTGITVCGWVNAKNSFGGYTGEEPYMVVLVNDHVGVALAVGGSENEQSATLKVCADAGVSL